MMAYWNIKKRWTKFNLNKKNIKIKEEKIDFFNCLSIINVFFFKLNSMIEKLINFQQISAPIFKIFPFFRSGGRNQY